MSKKIILGLLCALTLSACGSGQDTTDKSTADNALLGIDANANGVRDDVEAYIEERSISDPQKQAALFEAKALQAIFSVDTTSEDALAASTSDMMAAIVCMNQQFDNPDDAEALGVLLEEQTFNTPDRNSVYDKYNQAQEKAGLIINIPSGDTCQTI